MKSYIAGIWILATIVVVGNPRQTAAQDKPEPGWKFKAQAATVWLGGNSEASTYALSTSIKRIWPKATWSNSAGMLRTSSTMKTTRAVGTTESFSIDEETDREATAESYYARTKVDRDLGDKMHVRAGLDWLRNTFAGIDSRFLLAAGAGYTFSDTDELSAKLDAAVTYTFEEEVVDNPFAASKFPGLRAAYDVNYKATESTTLESGLTADLNLDNTDDLRLDWANAISVAINSSLSLKPSMLIQWKNDPALEEVDLYDAAGAKTGDKVLIPLSKTDWFFNLAIVLTL